MKKKSKYTEEEVFDAVLDDDKEIVITISLNNKSKDKK